ncbi:hypothetical protein [Streptomyces ardesiacus]
MKAYKVLGTTDDVTTCELCGKQELKGTVALMPLDADGNEDGEACYFGVSCAAKAAGWTLKEVRVGIKAAKEEALAEERARRIEEREAEKRAYNAWVAETYGSGATLKDAVQKHGVAGLWAQFRAAQAAPVVDEEPAEAAPFRETVLRVADEERTVRTELGDRVRTVKQLEAAHTKAVKAALVEMRRANLPAFEAAAKSAEDEALKSRGAWWVQEAAKRARNIARRAERGTTFGCTSAWASALKPLPKIRYTEEVPAYLVEIEPDHYATPEAAEQLALI